MSDEWEQDHYGSFKTKDAATRFAKSRKAKNPDKEYKVVGRNRGQYFVYCK